VPAAVSPQAWKPPALIALNRTALFTSLGQYRQQ